MSLKPYQSIPIQDCGEPLVPLPMDQFAMVDPHPYKALGAPYGEYSPYYVRAGVLQALLQAQAHLHITNPGWQIQIFDAYRPIAVQQFMVDYTYQQLLHAWQKEHPANTAKPPPKDHLLTQVYQFWAAPSHNMATPPPHSTGAAVDVTLVNAQQQVVDMGSAIDEISERSYPDYFSGSSSDSPSDGSSGSSSGSSFDGSKRHPQQTFHRHRTLLRQTMQAAGFRQHPNEWWHFSLGDQLWAWLETQAGKDSPGVAYYGRAH